MGGILNIYNVRIESAWLNLMIKLITVLIGQPILKDSYIKILRFF